MRTRLQLREYLLEKIGLSNMYFQPPSTVQMKYPCLIYGPSGHYIRHAENDPYVWLKSYRIIIVDKDPDSPYQDIPLTLPYCRFDRHYTADNLHHWVYQLYY